MASGAADGLFRYVYDGCLSGGDMGIERRPYHRNCRCALHDKSRENNCPHGLPKSKTVKYPIRRAWSEGCLAMAAAGGGGSSCHTSPSSSPSTMQLSEIGKSSSNNNLQLMIKIEGCPPSIPPN